MAHNPSIAISAIAPGTTILNGAIVIHQSGDVVLCVIPGNDNTPYATWTIDVNTGDTFSGDYHRYIDKAFDSYKRRGGRFNAIPPRRQS